MLRTILKLIFINYYDRSLLKILTVKILIKAFNYNIINWEIFYRSYIYHMYTAKFLSPIMSEHHDSDSVAPATDWYSVIKVFFKNISILFIK